MFAKLLLVALAGVVGDRCASWSIHPVYEAPDLVTDSRLPGKWYSGSAHWLVDSAVGQAYGVTVVDGGDTCWYGLHLARAGGMLLGDLLRRRVGTGDLLPLHQYALIDRLDSVLVYRVLDDEWLNEYLDAHPTELAHDVVDGSNLVTAPPRAVQAFLRRHASDSAAWLTEVLGRRPTDE